MQSGTPTQFSSAAHTYIAESIIRKGPAITSYLARDTSTDKRVFLKHLALSQMNDWKQLELFEREATVLKHISHPAIPSYIEDFSPEKGEYCLVQEWIDGTNCQTLIDNHAPIETSEFEEYLRQVLHILDYLHNLTPPTFHRDISPKNIMIADKQLYLVDFGAVRVSADMKGEATTVGTFGYMAPEQLLGRVGPKSDLYGLGMSFIALATHSEPTSLPMDVGSGRLDVAAQLHLPSPIKNTLLQMIEPTPDKRPGSAAEAIAMLSSTTPIQHTTTQRMLRIPTFKQVSKWTGITTATLCFVLFLGWLSTLPLHTHQEAKLGGWFTGHANLISAITDTFFGVSSAICSPNYIDAIAYAPNQKRLASFADGELRIWDLTTHKTIQVLTAPLMGTYKQTTFSQDGRSLYAITGGIFSQWTCTNQTCREKTKIYPHQQVEPQGGPLGYVAFSKATPGKELAVIQRRNQLNLVDITQNKVLFHAPIPNTYFYNSRMSFHQKGTLFAYTWMYRPKTRGKAPERRENERKFLERGNKIYRIAIWHIKRNKDATSVELTIPLSFKENIGHIAWHPTKPILAIRGSSYIMQWDFAKKKQIKSLTTSYGNRGYISWSPDGTMLADKLYDSTNILNAKTGEIIRNFSIGSYQNSSAWKPNSKQLAATNLEQVIGLWRVKP